MNRKKQMHFIMSGSMAVLFLGNIANVFDDARQTSGIVAGIILLGLSSAHLVMAIRTKNRADDIHKTN